VLLVACLAAVVWYWWQFVRPHRADGGRPPEKEVVVQPAMLPALPIANAALGSAGESTAPQEQPPLAAAASTSVASSNLTNAERATNTPPAEPVGVRAALPVQATSQIAATEKSNRAGEAGVIGFTKALAQEGAAKGVTVNCVAPGYIATEMVSAMHPDALAKVKAGIPCGRLGESEEIARAVLFLVEDPGFINGSTLTINGAQYIAG
jgi:hypothetical protein